MLEVIYQTSLTQSIIFRCHLKLHLLWTNSSTPTLLLYRKAIQQRFQSQIDKVAHNVRDWAEAANLLVVLSVYSNVSASIWTWFSDVKMLHVAAYVCYFFAADSSAAVHGWCKSFQLLDLVSWVFIASMLHHSNVMTNRQTLVQSYCAVYCMTQQFRKSFMTKCFGFEAVASVQRRTQDRTDFILKDLKSEKAFGMIYTPPRERKGWKDVC